MTNSEPDDDLRPRAANPFFPAEWIGFLRSDFMRKSAGTYLARIGTSMTALMTSVLVARYLGPQGRGDFSTAIAISSIGIQLAQMGWVVSNTWLTARDNSLLRPLLANSWVMSMVGGSLFSVLVLWVSYIFSVWVPIHGALLWVTLIWV